MHVTEISTTLHCYRHIQQAALSAGRRLQRHVFAAPPLLNDLVPGVATHRGT